MLLEAVFQVILNNTSFINKPMTDHTLKTQIRKGYAWLRCHMSPCRDESLALPILYALNKDRKKEDFISWNYNPKEYKRMLGAYESLVDEANKRGISEKSCWNYGNPAVEEMSFEEQMIALL